MAENTLKHLYLEELRDLYDAENQLIKALPKLAKNAESEELRSGIEKHLEQTKEHARRIEQIFESMDEKAKTKKCKGMQGIISEGNEALKDGLEGAVRDAAIIAGAQRVEHYEIAAYGAVREFAETLGETEAASLLAQTLDEEKETDQKLTQIARSVNQQATTGAGSSEEESEAEGEDRETRARRKAKTAGA
jgi:ferritin-like metal-binding protein YciE